MVMASPIEQDLCQGRISMDRIRSSFKARVTRLPEMRVLRSAACPAPRLEVYDEHGMQGFS
ncbi:hypothetical protein A1D31_36520 [Bradyrhizobium liaoningense]|nr:hypothetical protein A1D31_36520 [Bradyrhizobium liaoningense]